VEVLERVLSRVNVLEGVLVFVKETEKLLVELGVVELNLD
jgi:hypothetical protein